MALNSSHCNVQAHAHSHMHNSCTQLIFPKSVWVINIISSTSVGSSGISSILKVKGERREQLLLLITWNKHNFPLFNFPFIIIFFFLLNHSQLGGQTRKLRRFSFLLSPAEERESPDCAFKICQIRGSSYSLPLLHQDKDLPYWKRWQTVRRQRLTLSTLSSCIWSCTLDMRWWIVYLCVYLPYSLLQLCIAADAAVGPQLANGHWIPGVQPGRGVRTVPHAFQESPAQHHWPSQRREYSLQLV